MFKFFTPKNIAQLIPARSATTSKSDYGKVLCVCGSPNYRGAAALSCMGALRTGAGIVTLAAAENVIQSISSRIIEATFIPLPNDELLRKTAQKATAVLLGCGMPDDAQTLEMVKDIIPFCEGTIVLDAGALCSIKNDKDLLKTTKNPPIITPHEGEMCALTGLDKEYLSHNRSQEAAKFAKLYNCIVLLKGSRTIIAEPSGEIWQNNTGGPGLARGGSGDVLAGIIAGLLAIGLNAENAAACGAYIHGYAGDLCAARLSSQSMLPEDILQDLCSVFKENGR